MATDEETKSQLERFKEAARQLELDETEAAFDEKLRKIIFPNRKSGEENKELIGSDD